MDENRREVVDRRGFLRLAGMTGAAVAAASGVKLGTGLVGAGTAHTAPGGAVRFKAIGDLPKPPLPAYATQVVEGTVDVGRQSGLISSTIFAGGGGGGVAIPGLGRSVRVTNVNEVGHTLHVTGVIDDHSVLAAGESPFVQLSVDRARGVAVANVHGHAVELTLVP
jgi:hypothetical protein